MPPLPRSTLFPYTTLFRSDRGPKPVDVIGGDRVRDFEGDDATAVETARQSVEGLEPETHRVFREVLDGLPGLRLQDRKSTRLNSSHLGISYAVFCLKKKK